MSRWRQSPDVLIGLGLFAVALAWRLSLLAAFPFDGLYGQDAYAYFNYANDARASLVAGRPLPPFFWPPGYPLHVAAAMSLVGEQPVAAQAVSLIAGASIAPLTFALAREPLLDADARSARRAGVIAGAIVAVAGQLAISSLSIMADTTALAWATLSAWLVLRYVRTFHPATLVVASIAVSVATLTRWAYALLALPWALGVLVAWWRRRSTLDARRVVPSGFAAVAIGLVLVGGQLLPGASFTGDLQVYTWDPLNAFRDHVANIDGTFDYALPMGLYYARAWIDPNYLFPLLAPLWLIGVWRLARSGGVVAVLLAGWPLVEYGFLAGVTWQNPRFALALFPAIAAWVGLGGDWVWVHRPGWRRALSLLLAVALVGAAVWSVRVVGNFVAAKNLDQARVRRVERQLPGDARLITFGLTLAFQHYTDLDVFELYRQSPESLAGLVCGRDDVYLFADMSNIERQWRGLPPETNAAWLRAGPGLDAVDAFEGYILFKVGSQCPGAR